MSDVAVVDYGVGNLRSISQALKYLGSTVLVSSDQDEILASEKLVLPGVGAFGHAMKELRARDLIRTLEKFVSSGRTVLGICVGMQVLFDRGMEHGDTPGLGFLDGSVDRIPDCLNAQVKRKLPHIGWNKIYMNQHADLGRFSNLVEIASGRNFYFVHSYMARPNSPTQTMASCLYDGVQIPAVVGSTNILGVQFHPEKSGESGLELLRAFMSGN